MSGVGIDEASHRRPDWTEGEAIVLGNGEPWYFVRPVLDFRFVRVGGGKTILARGYVCGEYEAMVDRYVEADDAPAAAVALFDLAFHLLSLNYTLDHGQASRLLRRSRADGPEGEVDANTAMWDAVRDVALGNAPKPTAVG